MHLVGLYREQTRLYSERQRDNEKMSKRSHNLDDGPLSFSKGAHSFKQTNKNSIADFRRHPISSNKQSKLQILGKNGHPISYSVGL